MHAIHICTIFRSETLITSNIIITDVLKVSNQIYPTFYSGSSLLHTRSNLLHILLHLNPLKPFKTNLKRTLLIFRNDAYKLGWSHKSATRVRCIRNKTNNLNFITMKQGFWKQSKFSLH